MPELKTRAEFIKAIPKKFPDINKLYKLRDCTKAELIQGYQTGEFPERVKYASAVKKERSQSETTTKSTTSTSTEGFDPSIFENNPAFARPSNMGNNGVNSKNRTRSEPEYSNYSNKKQTIELECENNKTRRITPEELKDITGMDINELNEINRKQQEEQAVLKMQKIVMEEMNKLREMESLCSQAIEASIRLRNLAIELKNTARLGEHKEYAEVCENIAYVFGNRLASARTIHMDLCIHRDIPIPVVSYQPDEKTIDMVRLLNKIRRKYDFSQDRSIDSRYRKSNSKTKEEEEKLNEEKLNEEPTVSNNSTMPDTTDASNVSNVSNVSNNLPSAAI